VNAAEARFFWDWRWVTENGDGHISWADLAAAGLRVENDRLRPKLNAHILGDLMALYAKDEV
jgi:hypothetical protein